MGIGQKIIDKPEISDSAAQLSVKSKPGFVIMDILTDAGKTSSEVTPETARGIAKALCEEADKAEKLP